MRCFHGWLPLLGLAFTAASASAQSVIIINPYVGGPSFSYARLSRYGSFSISSGGYGLGYVGYPRASSGSLNVVTVNPAGRLIIVPRSSLGLDDDQPTGSPDTTGRREAIGPPADAAPMEKPLPGQDTGEFRPLAPDNRRQAERPIAPAPPLPPLPPKKADQQLPAPPLPPLPEANPIAENARLLKLGKEAFAVQEYGRAAQRFRQATTVLPNNAMSQFLLAQALLALGKYHEAIDAIYAGMALQPDWPLQRFQPLELYGEHGAAYPEHLRRLEDTLTKFPNDPVLLFLFAYQLWFDGRKDEARALFLRARPGAGDPAIVDRFLKAKPAAPPGAAGDVARS